MTLFYRLFYFRDIGHVNSDKYRKVFRTVHPCCPAFTLEATSTSCRLLGDHYLHPTNKNVKKVNLFLCLISTPPRRRIGEYSYTSTILDLGNKRRWVVRVTPRPLYPQGKVPGTHWIVDWEGPGVCVKYGYRKISCLCRESDCNLPARKPPLHRLSIILEITDTEQAILKFITDFTQEL